MKKYLPILFAVIIVAGFYFMSSISKPDDKVFREIDSMLFTKFNQLKIDYSQFKITKEQYLAELEELLVKEKELFEEVKQQDFDDKNEKDYWFNKRMKRPSVIQTELDKMQIVSEPEVKTE